MSGYNITHVIEECVVEKSRNLAPGVKREQYDETWAALNTWLMKRLKGQKGGEVGFLGTFTWEIQKQDDGSINTRPIFLIADSFVKDFNVRRQRVHYKPKTAKAEVVNYSQLAIKYTSSLTKDMVFAGVRDIMRKIGAFCARGATLDIHFVFGVLRIKERRVKFDFDPSVMGTARGDVDELEAALESLEAEIADEEEKEGGEDAKMGHKNFESDDKEGGRPAIPELSLPMGETKVDDDVANCGAGEAMPEYNEEDDEEEAEEEGDDVEEEDDEDEEDDEEEKNENEDEDSVDIHDKESELARTADEGSGRLAFDQEGDDGTQKRHGVASGEDEPSPKTRKLAAGASPSSGTSDA